MSAPGSNHGRPYIQLPRRESSLEPRQRTQDNGNTRRPPQATGPQYNTEQTTWAPREFTGYSPAGPSGSSGSSASNTGPSNEEDASRFTPVSFSTSNMPAEARRQNIMAMDRKRRLTGSAHESAGRRRNIAGVFDGSDESLHNRVVGSELVISSPRPQNSYRQHRSTSGSGTGVIDLTGSPPQPPLPPPNVSRRPSASTSSMYMVPTWQPDSQVSDCPICKRPFTFLFRRHHCRKCGRVVCNDCSPHRITIPRQFIVNPPGPYGQPVPGSGNTVDLTGDDEDGDGETSAFPGSGWQNRTFQNYGIGGGEKVRLCNPCVPDPQPEPRPSYAPNTLSTTPTTNRREDLMTLADALRSSRQAVHNSLTEGFPGFVSQYPAPYTTHNSRVRPLPLPPPPVPHAPQPRSQSYMAPASINALLYGPNNMARPANQHRNNSFDPDQQHRYRGTMSFEGPQIMHSRHHSAESSRALPQLIHRERPNSMLDDSYIPRIFSSNPPQPRVRLNEEDICPICRRALPPKGPNGDETARETHIMQCISFRDPANISSSSRGPGMHQPPPRGPMHMLPFIATEKDCVGDDGNVPECSICMVEYDVGDELARLECLCKFHRECISEWFGRKQECPVHKIS